MRNTLPNTDQPRTPHSEYHYTALGVRASLSGNGRRMCAVLTITGRIDVLGKEINLRLRWGQ